MLDAVFTSAVEFVANVVLAYTGRAVPVIFSFGGWRGEREDEGLIHSPGDALSFKRNGQRVLTTLGLQFLGGLFWVCAIAIAIGVAFHTLNPTFQRTASPTLN